MISGLDVGGVEFFPPVPYPTSPMRMEALSFGCDFIDAARHARCGA